MIPFILVFFLADVAQVCTVRRLTIFQSVADHAVEATVCVRQQTRGHQGWLGGEQADEGQRNGSGLMVTEVVTARPHRFVDEVADGKKIGGKKCWDHDQIIVVQGQLRQCVKTGGKLRQFFECQ